MTNYFDHKKVTPATDVKITITDHDAKCASCGKRHQNLDQLEIRLCWYEKTKRPYCDTFCFHWRYYDPRHNPKRFEALIFNEKFLPKGRYEKD